MKNLTTLSLTLLISVLVFAQDKYLTKIGTINLEASVPSFEEVKATNEATTFILNTANGEFAALVFVKAFRFKNALMEEHFNENYAESDTYPKANFKGKLIDFDLNKLSDNQETLNYTGTLEFHGKIKTLEKLPITISKNDTDQIILTGTFEVSVDDFDIDIPKVVSNKLSKTVVVTFNFNLSKKQ